mmetsp:Transcript_1352/g.3355  ORF Transcript_1352/g.3355 Transcript_1352/m.3355 type:complete len:274 (+) Transcript_1352:28-849(+)
MKGSVQVSGASQVQQIHGRWGTWRRSKGLCRRPPLLGRLPSLSPLAVLRHLPRTLVVAAFLVCGVVVVANRHNSVQNQHALRPLPHRRKVRPLDRRRVAVRGAGAAAADVAAGAAAGVRRGRGAAAAAVWTARRGGVLAAVLGNFLIASDLQAHHHLRPQSRSLGANHVLHPLVTGVFVLFQHGEALHDIEVMAIGRLHHQLRRPTLGELLRKDEGSIDTPPTLHRGLGEALAQVPHDRPAVILPKRGLDHGVEQLLRNVDDPRLGDLPEVGL